MALPINEDSLKSILGELSSSVTLKTASNGNVQIAMSTTDLKAASQLDIWRTFVNVCEALESAGYPYTAMDSWFNREDQTRVPWPHVWVNAPTAEENANVQRDDRLSKVEDHLSSMAQMLQTIIHNGQSTAEAPTEQAAPATDEKPF